MDYLLRRESGAAPMDDEFDHHPQQPQQTQPSQLCSEAAAPGSPPLALPMCSPYLTPIALSPLPADYMYTTNATAAVHHYHPYYYDAAVVDRFVGNNHDEAPPPPSMSLAAILLRPTPLPPPPALAPAPTMLPPMLQRRLELLTTTELLLPLPLPQPAAATAAAAVIITHQQELAAMKAETAMWQRREPRTRQKRVFPPLVYTSVNAIRAIDEWWCGGGIVAAVASPEEFAAQLAQQGWFRRLGTRDTAIANACYDAPADIVHSIHEHTVRWLAAGQTGRAESWRRDASVVAPAFARPDAFVRFRFSIRPLADAYTQVTLELDGVQRALAPPPSASRKPPRPCSSSTQAVSHVRKTTRTLRHVYAQMRRVALILDNCVPDSACAIRPYQDVVCELNTVWLARLVNYETQCANSACSATAQQLALVGPALALLDELEQALRQPSYTNEGCGGGDQLLGVVGVVGPLRRRIDKFFSYL